MVCYGFEESPGGAGGRRKLVVRGPQGIVTGVEHRASEREVSKPECNATDLFVAVFKPRSAVLAFRSPDSPS